MDDLTNHPSEEAELTEPARPERVARGLAKVQNFTITTPGEKAAPKIITTEHRRPTLPPPRKLRDTEAILEKRQELQRLELEIENEERERQALENRLEGVEREIDVRVRQLNVIAGECARVESKELPEQFLLL